MPFNPPLTASSLTLKASRQHLKQTLIRTRTVTLGLLEQVNAETFRLQAHPEFSPVGWHLGHIGFTEGLWLLEKQGGYPPLFPEYRRLFAADGLAKAERQNLPTYAEICAYLDQIRWRVWDYLAEAPVDTQARLWLWLVQHESQHCETIAWILQLHRRQQQPQGISLDLGFGKVFPAPASHLLTPEPVVEGDPRTAQMVKVAAGPFLMGNEGVEAMDNERSPHLITLPDYWIDPYLVSQGDYRQFIASGGYQTPDWWSAAGWNWLQNHPVTHPDHWRAGDRDQHPVCGVSGYEAEAYARFVGKRLPTEAEWEKAARWHPHWRNFEAILDYPQRQTPWGGETPTPEHCNYGGHQGQTTPVDHYSQGQSAYGCYDLLGNVWEWTATWFHPYPNFRAYPYQGYSQHYFDQGHRVLKGGSWATQAPVLRCTFRNWYEPHTRIHFAGFRCAYS